MSTLDSEKDNKMFDPQNKTLFIHIPKTGGGSIEMAIKENLTMHDQDIVNKNNKILRKFLAKFLTGWDDKHKLFRQHLTILEIKKFYNTIDLSNCFKFTVVRNPWDRMVSSFHWERTNKLIEKDARISSNFKEFARNPRWYRSQHSKSQLDFITDESFNIKVDFICRFENLQEDFNSACIKGNIPPRKLLHEHKSERKHYTEYYDDETKQIVAEKYAKDIEYFGYKFGES